MASRDIRDLHPIVAEKAGALLGAATLLRCPIFITCTLRTEAEQADLFAQGRTKPGKIVTWVGPGRSFHQYGLAFDIAFRPEDDPDGASWDGPWDLIGRMGEQLGLEWGGRWRKATDRPHFQDPLGRTIDEWQGGQHG
jgi:peptidoglycan L-alanyl-D-glutamate endopeptidase CwlK